MQWLLALSTLAGLYLISNLWSLLVNYLAARRSGLPTYICLSNPFHPVWMVFSVPLRPIFRRCLPKFLFDRIKMTIYCWEFEEKYSAHAKLGKNFILVTPGPNELWIADPELAHHVLA